MTPPARSSLLPLAVVAALSGLAACALQTSGLPLSSGTGSYGGSGGAGPGSGGGPSGSGGHGGTPPTCASSDCEEIPQGWTLVRARRPGPSTAGDASAPACADGSAPAAYLYGPASAGCTPCACDQPMGAACSSPQITCSYGANDCSGNDLQKQDDNPGCTMIWPPAGVHSDGSCSLTADAHLTNPGTCSTSGGAVTPTAPWTGTILICPESASGAGCGDGQSCLPSGATADGSLCITQAGSDPCPPGWTGDVTTAFEDGADTRTCSTCACNVQCSGGDWVVYDDDLCSDSNNVTVSSQTCTRVADIFDWSQASVRSHAGTPALASCDGGDAKGGVQGTSPHQICCK